MAAASIPVDLFNPGQVFACLGFLEGAETLLGDAECRFDWSHEAETLFHLQANSEKNPIGEMLAFLATADVVELEPIGWPGPSANGAQLTDLFPSPLTDHRDEKKKWSRTKFPIELVGTVGQRKMKIGLQNWADGSTRPSFKLYSGNRSALVISDAMLCGTRDNPTKKHPAGRLETKGVVQLWNEQSEVLLEDPFGTRLEHAPELLVAMGGSFNFDPRGSWTPINAGYSPDKQNHQVAASPLVELLAELGIENTRPDEYETRQVRYSVWGISLTPMLARAALFGGLSTVPQRRFRFQLAMSGKNKVVTYAQEEPCNDCSTRSL
jgi:CRISPR-associated protein Csx14